MTTKAMSNAELARLLQEFTDLMKLEEGSPQAFRVRAYEKAVAAVRDHPAPVSEMSDAELQQLEGVGKSTAAKIRELLDTGTMKRLEALRSKYPVELIELTRIPGLGPKTVLLLRDQLDVHNVEQLKEAIAGEKLRELPGLGARSEEKIAKAIERMGLHGKDRRTPVERALAVAGDVMRALEGLPEVLAIEPCGSLRRFRDTIGDIDIVVAAKDSAPVMDAFVALSSVVEVLGHGPTKSSVLTATGIQIDLRVVEPDEYGAALVYFTGSKQHNIELRQRALSRGWTLNEYALADAETEDVVAAATEEDIYAALEMAWVPPELREGLGEVAFAAERKLPELVEVGDIRGDLHVHSAWSGDGRSSLEDMVSAAAERGLSYVAITDHGENLTINGLSREQVMHEREEIEELRITYPKLTILHGAELNIDPDGGVDYDEEFLAGFDWCVASVHSHFDLPQAQQTERVITAMHNPNVNVIGHLTGRKLGKRPGIELDHAAVLDAAAATGTALEINSHLARLDVPADVLRLARDRSDITFVISTDSHHVKEYDNLRWGVANARRGWVPKRQIANTWTTERFLGWVGEQRRF